MAIRSGLRLHLQIEDDRLQAHLDRARLRRWVLASLERPAELTLRFVGRAEGRALNRQYRGKDYPTNVLTFAYSSDGDGGERVTADLVFCGPVLLAQARAQRKSVADHLAHLVVHATLHAQGWDHETDADAERMEALEARILRRFGIGDPYASAVR